MSSRCLCGCVKKYRKHENLAVDKKMYSEDSDESKYATTIELECVYIR